MEKKLAEISSKVDTLVNRIEGLSCQNVELASENRSLKSEISRLKKIVRETSLGKSDQNELVKRKLTMVLQRLDELETLAG